MTVVVFAITIAKIKKTNLFSIDGLFALLGSFLGLCITFLNMVYSNNYLITIGPLMSITCLLYIVYKDKFQTTNTSLVLSLTKDKLKLIQIVYWLGIITSLLAFYQAQAYHRPLLLFVSLSISVASLGIEILSINYENYLLRYKVIFKILLVSIITRSTAFFISSFPVGSDPWVHAELINDIAMLKTSVFPESHVYYTNYPLMHLFASITTVIGEISVKGSMSIIGIILVFATIFVYLAIKHISGDEKLALFSMLILNFSDFHMQWSIQIIAMTFGLSLYSILICLLFIKNNVKNKLIFTTFLVLFAFIIVWTHTISSFIFLVSLISLYLGNISYNIVYNNCKIIGLKPIINFSFFLLFLTILLYHWMDPKYPFINPIIEGFANSLSSEAKFLGREVVNNQDSLISIIEIAGFLIFTIFGIIGSLFSLSKEHKDVNKISLLTMLLVLFFIFFVFPVMGIRNIVPYRWPAFIYTTFVFFVGIGMLLVTKSIKGDSCRKYFIFILLISFVFLNITNSITNMDSPVIGEDSKQILIWKDSEMKLFENVNNTYQGNIITDHQTRLRPFNSYLRRQEAVDYNTISEGYINRTDIGGGLVLWRTIYLERPMQPHYSLVMEEDLNEYFDVRYKCIYDIGTAKAYL
nr:hypothetical protein [uncultured Methanolobus sp.]